MSDSMTGFQLAPKHHATPEACNGTCSDGPCEDDRPAKVNLRTDGTMPPAGTDLEQNVRLRAENKRIERELKRARKRIRKFLAWESFCDELDREAALRHLAGALTDNQNKRRKSCL